MADAERLYLIKKKHHIRKTKRSNVFMYAQMTYFCQVFLLWLITLEILSEGADEMLRAVKITEIYCRWICATILHLALLGEVLQGIKNMKFALNH